MENLIRINNSNVSLIENFVENLGNSVKTFRYFEKRDIHVIKNHIITFLLCIDNIPTAYGHLDKEDNNIWLGIAVIESARGKGYGKKMLQTLIDFGKTENIEEITLSVDDFNSNAIQLYKKFGFVLHEKRANTLFLKLFL